MIMHNLICVLILLNLCTKDLYAQRTVSVEIKSNWPRQSLGIIAETAEFLSDQSSEFFWAFVDGMCKESAIVDKSIVISSVIITIFIYLISFNN